MGLAELTQFQHSAPSTPQGHPKQTFLWILDKWVTKQWVLKQTSLGSNPFSIFIKQLLCFHYTSTDSSKPPSRLKQGKFQFPSNQATQKTPTSFKSTQPHTNPYFKQSNKPQNFESQDVFQPRTSSRNSLSSLSSTLKEVKMVTATRDSGNTNANT